MTNPQPATATQGVLLPPPPRRLILLYVVIDGEVKVDYQEDNK